MSTAENQSLQCTACHKNLIAEQNYCVQCGQKIGKKRMTLWSIITDTFSNYFSFERSGLATVYKVIRQPEFMVKNYYNGNKGYFASPGKLVIFSIILIALHLTFVNDKILEATFDFHGISKEYAFFLFNFVIFTLISQVTFIRLGFKFTLHAISIIYLSAAFLIFFLLAQEIMIMVGIPVPSSYYFIYLLCVLFWNSIVFTKNKTWWWIVINFVIQVIVIFIFIITLAQLGLLEG